MIGKTTRVRSRGRAAAAFGALGPLLFVWLAAACTPTTVASLGADAAYTGAEARTTDEVIDDNEIKLALNRYFVEADPGLFAEGVDSSNYRVRSVLGTVYVVGSVASIEEFDRVVALVRSFEDVRNVETHVEIR